MAHDEQASAPSTREQLIAAVIAIAGEQGQQAVTYRSVAERANVTHGLVRHYFGTRQAMVAEAFERAVTEDLDEVVLATNDVTRFAEGIFSFEDETRDRRLLQFDVMLNAIRGGDAELAHRLYDRYLGEVRRTIRQLGIDDPDDAWVNLIFSTLDGLTLQQSLYRDPARSAAVIARLRELLSWLAERGTAPSA